MKERPILFNGEMVRAILDGRKTMTRRMVKPQPHEGSKLWGMIQHDGEPRALFWCEGQPSSYGTPLPMNVGDRLWVRETFRIYNSASECACYDECKCARMNGKPLYRASDPSPDDDKWTPSIHMPRWASRITLEITGVRVERVQEMEGMDAASSDALKEGVHRIHHEGGNYYYSAFRNQPDPKNWTDPCLAFKELWQSIYANWDANPWVWVYEFRRIKP